MAESISPERMQRLMELSNNAMTVELGALRNPQVTTVPSSNANAFYQSAPYAEREINKYLYEQYKNIEKAQEKFADGDLSKYRFEEAISDAEFEINKLKNFYENGLDQRGLDYLDQKQQEGISSLKDTVSTEFNPDFSMPELDQSRDQIVLGEKMSESVLAHEMGHAAFSEAKDFFRSKVVELGSIEDALKATALEYGENIANKIYAGVRGNLDGFFADTDEATVQYYDNPLGDDPSNPGGGTPTSEGGPTYYSPGGGFDADTDNTFSFLPFDRANATDPLLQKPFTDYRTGELVYHDEYKGDFEADLKKAGLMGFETLMSDLISERKGLDRFAERQRRGLKINPLGAPPSVAHETIRDEYGKILFNKGAETGGTQVLRSVRPKTRPEKFAQGGPVMRGIGTLNETARNMFRGPRGIGAYQQFADGGPVYMQEGGDPNFKLLVQAVQKVESNFDSRAVSEDGAIGLMQILPTTAAQPGYEKYGAENVFDIAERLMGFRDERTVENARALLFDPEINVEFGTKYLQAMIRDSGGDILQALQKYNAGVGNYQAFEEDPENNPLDQEAVQYPIKVTAAYQNFDPSNPLELAQFSNRPEAASQMMAMYEQPEPELVRPRLRPEFLGDKGVTTSLRPQLRPQGIMSIQDPAVMDRVVEQVQEELPPTQEERDLYEKYSPENMFPDAGLTEGEMIRRERFAPKDGDAEPYRQPPSMLEQIDQFFQRFAPSRKPERVIQPKPTPMQYRSA